LAKPIDRQHTISEARKQTNNKNKTKTDL